MSDKEEATGDAAPEGVSQLQAEPGDSQTAVETEQAETEQAETEKEPVEVEQTETIEAEPTEQTEAVEAGPTETEQTEPTDTEPGQTESATTGQVEAEQTETVETEPAEQTETEQTEPAEQTETKQTEPAEQTETEQTESTTAETVETEQVEPVQTGSAEMEGEPIGTEEQAADAGTTEEPSESEQVEAAPAETQPVEQAADAEPVEQAADAEPVKQAADAETEPVEQVADAKSEPVEQAADAKPEPVEQAADAKPEPVEQAADAKPEPVEQAVAGDAPPGPEVAAAGVSEKPATQEPVVEGEKKEDLPAQKDKPEVQRESKHVGDDTPMEKDKYDIPALAISSEQMVERPVSLRANATVKFVLMPSGQVVTLACTLGQTLKQLKDHFASELKMPFSLILLMHDGKGMADDTTLADLGVGPNGTVQLELQSADPVNMPIKAYRPRQEYHMPDVITVRVQAEGDLREVIVEIERTTRKKPYLGGYRHKDTGVEFHNASAQTMKILRPPPPVDRYCRDTQTMEQWHRLQQTSNDMATQMTKIGVYVSNMPDKLISPRRYTTADEHLDMVLQKIIILQKYYRRWLAKRRVQKLRDDKKKRLDWEREEELRKIKEKEDRIKQEFARRMNPKNKDDFDLLYHALEKWRLEEIERINSTLTGAERKAALYMLLDQETQLLAAIDRHKLEADDTNKKLRILTFLDKAAAPKTWKGRDGRPTQMDTPYTIRARELKDIYNSINMKYLTQDERLDVLLTLKHTVTEHDCKLTQEIIELIDREADLLMRGVKEANLDGLRRRISTLFLQYIRTPTFNPEAAKLLKVPQDPSTLRKNIYFCSGCNNYLPSTEFPLSSNSRVVGKCRQCNKIDNDGRVRQDYSHYRYMLKMLRLSEEAYGDQSQIAFLLQESDLRYLVENIWSSQSTLSAWDDIFDLVLVRWDSNEEWSPWNCILLTRDEASAHDKLHSLEEGYGQVFIHKVKQKHTLARNYFSRLPGMAELVRQKASQKDTGTRGPSVAGTSVPVQQKA
ncbi:IQ and ubiquitin-like domain-containing protein isoform X2 [Gigantopelta aegis]|uniref:IQ and ubiquitin-like domain-containing protein isoform X2 n=1 Tax=Gigantopelta aegis TaxID=1735272 RepID=UPI001B88BA77|nr:IQ and ubiquitin-like domain-containing protein isoform X2 [Gigantopelta aegis]